MYDLLRWRQWFSLEWPSLYSVRRAAIFIRAFTCFFRNSIFGLLGNTLFLTLNIRKVAVRYAGNLQMIIFCSSNNLLSEITDSRTWEFGFYKWNFYNLAYFCVDKSNIQWCTLNCIYFIILQTLSCPTREKEYFHLHKLELIDLDVTEKHLSLCT